MDMLRETWISFWAEGGMLATVFITNRGFYRSEEQHPRLWFSNLVRTVLVVRLPYSHFLVMTQEAVLPENPGR